MQDDEKEGGKEVIREVWTESECAGCEDGDGGSARTKTTPLKQQ